jgi:hypothetical protein
MYVNVQRISLIFTIMHSIPSSQIAGLKDVLNSGSLVHNMFMPVVDRDAALVDLYICKVVAGFPSPADDYVEKSLDLNELLIKRPAATFYQRAS